MTDRDGWVFDRDALPEFAARLDAEGYVTYPPALDTAEQTARDYARQHEAPPEGFETRGLTDGNQSNLARFAIPRPACLRSAAQQAEGVPADDRDECGDASPHSHHHGDRCNLTAGHTTTHKSVGWYGGYSWWEHCRALPGPNGETCALPADHPGAHSNEHPVGISAVLWDAATTAPVSSPEKGEISPARLAQPQHAPVPVELNGVTFDARHMAHTVAHYAGRLSELRTQLDDIRDNLADVNFDEVTHLVDVGMDGDESDCIDECPGCALDRIRSIVERTTTAKLDISPDTGEQTPHTTR